MTAPTLAALRHADADRLRTHLDTFAGMSEPGRGPGITRLAYTPLERQAHDVFGAHMRALGLDVRTDTAGNTLAELPGTTPGLPGLGTGSHLDSVPGAGAYDGIAGVVAAMEVARLFVSAGIRLTRPVRFVAFAAEEGARFGQACTGSRIAAGLTGPADLKTKQDAEGVSLAQAMTAVGLDPNDTETARWRGEDWAAFLELHIEQGSLLESESVPVGLVDLISGSTRLRLDLTGRASHTGGTPMRMRADAMAAAAEIILMIETLANDSRHHGTRATVGRMDVSPGSLTTIAGSTEVYVDVRDVDNDRQRLTAAEIVESAQHICSRRGIGCESRLLADASPVILPRWLRDTVAEAAAEAGITHRVMPSGASHDAQMINRVVPTGMIFVPSHNGGVSHSPEELTFPAELAVGTDILASGLLRLDARLSAQEAAAA
ncbi:Zn-dependent hydrolase [Streptomyces sp. WAC 06738]|uniref:Zn-dependent hydrolase n=1 Tax=Streptomyces sp. WAC 06738 TaxID=2203210 RepID=UPI000F6B3C63|nr:Zn-dependent hydrolase [Streptomyces sp. WAC 06738]AZM46631.1 Zn-dependent hydrolase [Streptomyces sp. WAC 06738]